MLRVKARVRPITKAYVPATVPMWVEPKWASGQNKTELNAAWISELDELNAHSTQAQNYVKGDTAGLFNPPARFPFLSSVTMCWNVLTLSEIRRDNRGREYGRVRTLNANLPPPSIEEMNYWTRPDVIWKFTCIRANGAMVNPPPGDVFFPAVSDAPVWIPLELLENFPQLPMAVRVRLTTWPWLNVRKAPNGSADKAGQLRPLEAATVVEYRPRASEVWGRITVENSGLMGWICLCQGARYYTSWRMETDPPFMPAVDL